MNRKGLQAVIDIETVLHKQRHRISQPVHTRRKEASARKSYFIIRRAQRIEGAHTVYQMDVQ
jgi:hypothetical protein